MKKIAVLLFAGSAALSAWSQNEAKVIGKIVNVKGLVTVISANQLTTAVNEARLIANSRVFTTASGGATLRFDNGCDITLENNQSITVKDGQTCAALLAAVTSNAADGGMAFVVAAGPPNVLPGVILLGGALGLIIGQNNQTNTSPN